MPTVWIAPDEMIYGLLGRSLYHSGRFEILGAPTGFFSLVFPALIGAPLAFGGPTVGFALAKAVEALTMSLAAVPAFLWARTLVSTRLALLAAALTLSVPALAYTGLLMTETAFYPLLAMVAFAMARAVERPTGRLQALVVGLIAVAALTRVQAIVLVPVFLTALVLDAVLARRRPSLRALAPTLLGIGALALAWLGRQLLSGDHLLGAYGIVAGGGYHFGAVLRYVLYHVGDLVLLSGFFPVCALLLLGLEVVARRERSPAVRAYVAVAVSLAGWLVLEVGVFASLYVGQLAERDLVGLAPMLFVGFCVWLGRGAPRGRMRSSLVAVAVLAPVFALPLDSLLTKKALPDAFTLIPIFDLLGHSALATQQLVIDGSLVVAALLLVLLPWRALLLVPLALVALFGAGSVSASHYVRFASTDAQRTFLGTKRDWIDDAATGQVAYLYAGSDEYNIVWQSVFWNRRIARVVTIEGAQIPGPLHAIAGRLRPDGRVAGAAAPAPLVIASRVLQLAGDPVADAGEIDGTPVGPRLWRVSRPLRVLSRSHDVQPNGDIYGQATVVAYGCSAGRLRLTLLGKQDETVELRRRGELYRRVHLTPNQIWRGTVPVPPDLPGTCEFEISSTGLLGTTQLTFEPR